METYYNILRTQFIVGGKRVLDERRAKVKDLEAYRKSIREEVGDKVQDIFFTYEERPLPKEETKLKLTIKYEKQL